MLAMTIREQNQINPARRSSVPSRPAPHRGLRRTWGVVFLVSSVLGAILAGVGTHLENENGGAIATPAGNPPGSGLVTAGTVLLLVAFLIAVVWLVRVIDRRIAQPLGREIEIALGPLPPVEAVRHPDGSVLSPEEQAVVLWQMARRQAQARQNVAAIGLLFWLGHHHGDTSRGHR